MFFKDAVQALNNLQTNASVVQQSISRAHDLECNNIKETEKYLIRSGINYEDLNKLSIIHVSGTKGKVCEGTLPLYRKILILINFRDQLVL